MKYFASYSLSLFIMILNKYTQRQTLNKSEMSSVNIEVRFQVCELFNAESILRG